MKQWMLLTLIFALAFTGCFNTNQNIPAEAKPKYHVTIALENLGDIETSEIVQLLTTHFKTIGVIVFGTKADIPNHQITFDISDNDLYGPDRLKTELTRFQSFGIWETYQNTDEKIAVPFVEMFGKYNLADKFNPSITIFNQDPSAIIGDAAIQDIPLLDSLFGLPENIQSLPNDAVLRWSFNAALYADEPAQYELYALKKSTTGEGFMTNRDIQMVEGGKDESGKYFINLEFKQEKKSTFALYTRKVSQNAGAIAFVLDDRVLMAPIVNNEVSGGKAVIYLDFTAEETEKIVAELKLASSSIVLRIMDFKVL